MFKLDAVVVFLDALECESFFKNAFKARSSLFWERNSRSTAYMSWEKATKSTILYSIAKRLRKKDSLISILKNIYYYSCSLSLSLSLSLSNELLFLHALSLTHWLYNNFQSLFHALTLSHTHSNNDSKLTATHVKEIKHNLNPINYIWYITYIYYR